MSEFGKNKSRSDGLQSKCKNCDCEYKAKKYQENKEVYKNRAKRRRVTLVEWFKELKQGLNCCQCKEDRWYVLEFHHRDPSDKKAEVCDMVHSTFGKKAILEEIKKCDCLCANCHREVHFIQNGLVAETE